MAEDSGAGAEESAPAPAEPPAEAAGTSQTLQAARAVLLVGGTPEEVVALLREAGLDARIVGRAVEVTDATEGEVDRVLEELGSGPVTVTVIEPSSG